MISLNIYIVKYSIIVRNAVKYLITVRNIVVKYLIAVIIFFNRTQITLLV